jgi:hypothetical protein
MEAELRGRRRSTRPTSLHPTAEAISGAGACPLLIDGRNRWLNTIRVRDRHDARITTCPVAVGLAPADSRRSGPMIT